MNDQNNNENSQDLSVQNLDITNPEMNKVEESEKTNKAKKINIKNALPFVLVAGIFFGIGFGTDRLMQRSKMERNFGNRQNFSNGFNGSNFNRRNGQGGQNIQNGQNDQNNQNGQDSQNGFPSNTPNSGGNDTGNGNGNTKSNNNGV